MRLKYSRAEMFKGRYMQSRWKQYLYLKTDPDPLQNPKYVSEWGAGWKNQLQRLRRFLKGELLE